MIRKSREVVEQAIDKGVIGRFREEIWAFDAGAPLHLVRKTSEAGPSKGPVVLVHGFAQNRYSWHTSTRSMANGLAQYGWDVYNLELRGHGRSRVRGGPHASQFSDYVEDLVRVAEHFEGRAFFVGHSLGGAACYGASTLGPMAGVVGIGAPFDFARHNTTLRAICRMTRWARPLLWKGGQIHTGAAGTFLARNFKLADALSHGLPVTGWQPGSVEPDLFEERVTKGFDWTAIEVWQEMARWSKEGFPYREAWKTSRTPVLVMVGDRDHLMPLGDARGAYDLSGAEDRTLHLFDDYLHEVHWGHLDLVLGEKAPRHTWTVLNAWMSERELDVGRDGG